MRKILFILVVVPFVVSSAFCQTNQIDNLRTTLDSTNQDISKVDLLIEIANVFKNVSYDSMNYYGHLANDLSKKIKYKKGEASSDLIIGFTLWKKGKLEEGKAYCEKALQLAEAHDFVEIQANSLINIGLIQNYEGNYSEALDYYQRALDLAESINNVSIKAGAFHVIGGIYYNLSDFDQALVYWKRAFSFQLDINDTVAAASALNNIGLAYSEMGDLNEALIYYDRATKIYSNMTICAKIYPYENIGSIYYKFGELDSAETYLEKSLAGAKFCGDRIVEAGTISELAQVSISRKQYKQALTLLHEGYDIGIRYYLKRETSLIAKLLTRTYELIGDVDSAFKYSKIYYSMQDSLFHGGNAKEIGRLEAKYEFERKQNEKEIQRKINELQKEKLLEREVWIRNSFIVGFILMLLIAFLMYLNVKRKLVANHKLEALNQEISTQKEELQAQAETLKELNESLNMVNDNLELKIINRTNELREKNAQLEKNNKKLAEYAFINAHKLRAPVATILGLIELFNNDKIDITEKALIVDKLKLSSVELDDIVKQISIILEEEGLIG